MVYGSRCRGMTGVSDPLGRARGDLSSLEDQIALHDDAIRRHEAEKQTAIKAADEVRSFIRLYEFYNQDVSGTVIDSTAKAGFTMAERISRVAEEEIRGAGHRVPLETICRAVVSAGIPVGGRDNAAKRNNVSGILSRNPRFHGLRHRGWWLRSLGQCPDDPPPQNTEAADIQSQEQPAASAEPRPTGEGAEPVRPVNPWPGGGT
jgi:hypothetical protein